MQVEWVTPPGMFRAVRAHLAKREIEQPVLIVGCGRSGTTILGSALGKHPQITYLNEPRRLWARVYPESDVWSRRARARGGRLRLEPADTDDERSRAMRRIFERRAAAGPGCTLLEKLPANSFRIGFLRAVFPDARFVHIFRNGIEVASSIATYAERDPWWGVGDYKWKQLSTLAACSPETAALPALCHTAYHRGLLEWRLTTEALVAELSRVPPGIFLELSYAQLVRDPAASIERVLNFAGLDVHEAVVRFAADNVSRRSVERQAAEPTELEATLGGRLLSISMDPNAPGLVPATSLEP